MTAQVCLFILRQDVNGDYDTYDSAVVAAYTAHEAKEIHPAGTPETVSTLTSLRQQDVDGYHYQLSTWADIQHIKVDFLGIADVTIKAGDIICSSFNAG